MITAPVALNDSRRLRPTDDSGIALLTVIMLMTLVTTLSLVVLGLVLSQSGPTLLAEKNVRTLAAAQAGIEATAAQIRHATSPDGTGKQMGDMHLLPCVVNGTVDGAGAGTYYEVAVQYFTADPSDKDDAWRTANALNCHVGPGTGGLRTVPHYAVMTAEGFDPTATAQQTIDRADRVVEARYIFSLTTFKVSGGLIRDHNSSFCASAEYAGKDAKIHFYSIDSDECKEGTELNSWSWKDDYMIHLASTDVSGVTPLCLSGRTNSSTPVPMTLQKCSPAEADPLGQKFSWDGGTHTWRGQTESNRGYGNSYIVTPDATLEAGDALSVSTSGRRSLDPQPAVGKGNASHDTDQVVNFRDFGRCLDVTNENIGSSFMIAYPCKQDPSGKDSFSWNHKWYYEEPVEGQGSVETKLKVNTGTQYCLTTPSLSGSYPRFFTNCWDNDTDWIRYGQTGDDNAYTIQDRHGRCLMIGDDSAHPRLDDQWSRIIVDTCTGAETQQWNVPPDPIVATLDGYEELTGRMSDD